MEARRAYLMGLLNRDIISKVSIWTKTKNIRL